MVSEQDAASMEGPRALKQPGDPAWCWQTVSALQSMWKGLDLNLEMYLRTWADAEEHRIWEKIPYESPYGSKEAMLEQLAIGDELQARAHTSEQAVVAIPLRQNGGARKKGEQSKLGIADRKYGNNADYYTARIARDHPEILERMIRGEFSSVRAAAKEAGIYRNPQPRTRKVTVNHDVEKLAHRIRELLGPSDFGRFADVISYLSADEGEKDKDD